MESYKKVTTQFVQKICTFDNDFDTPGDFLENEYDKKVNLELFIRSGYLQQGKWVTSNAVDDDAYLVFLNYRNYYMIEVELMAQCENKERFIHSFDFVKEAAKKFFLFNSAITEIMKLCTDAELYSKWVSDDEPDWDWVEKTLDYAKNSAIKLSNKCDLNSWHKVMTIPEAIQLFDYLQIPVRFPHRYIL